MYLLIHKQKWARTNKSYYSSKQFFFFRMSTRNSHRFSDWEMQPLSHWHLQWQLWQMGVVQIVSRWKNYLVRRKWQHWWLSWTWGLSHHFVNYYRPQQGCDKVMFSVMSVCLSIILTRGGSYVTITRSAFGLGHSPSWNFIVERLTPLQLPPSGDQDRNPVQNVSLEDPLPPHPCWQMVVIEACAVRTSKHDGFYSNYFSFLLHF